MILTISIFETSDEPPRSSVLQEQQIKDVSVTLDALNSLLACACAYEDAK